MTRFHFQRPGTPLNGNIQNIAQRLNSFVPPQGFPGVGGGPPVLTSTYTVDGGSFLTAVKFNNLDPVATPGTKMFIISSGDDLIRQYSLINPFDMTQSNVSLVAGTFDTSTNENIPTGMEWDPPGAELFVTGDQSSKVFQFGAAGTAYDLSTVSTTPRTTNLQSLVTVPTGLVFDDIGSKLFISSNTPDGVQQFTLPSNYSIQGVSVDDGFFNASPSGVTNPRSIAFPTANKMFLLDIGTNKIVQYSVSNDFDVTTGTIQSTKEFDLTPFGSTFFGLTFSNDGFQMFVLDRFNKVLQFTLSSSFQL